MDIQNDLTKGEMKHPMVQAIYSSPLTASVISKLVSQPTNTGASAIRDTKTGAEASRGELNQASLELQRNITDNRNAMELFPDIELSKQTLVSSIIAPNNMLQEDLNITIEHPNVPVDVSSDILQIIKPEIENYYKLDDKVFKIIENVLFTKGSHIEIVLPESAVDHLINERPLLRLESMRDVNRIFDELETGTLGFIGPKDQDEILRFESHNGEKGQVFKPTDESGSILSKHITVGDNFGILKKPFYREAAARSAVKSRIRSLQRKTVEILKKPVEARMESFTTKKTISNSDLKNSIYKNPNTGQDLFLRVPDRDNLQRHSIGRPLDLTLPSESFIPLHFPGDPTRCIGGFALLDQDGYFLSMDSNRKYLMAAQHHVNQISTNATSNHGSNTNISSSLLEKAKNNLKGSDNTIPLTYLAELFGTVLEEDLLKRIRNGIYSTEAAISRNNDIYAVMLARALSGSQTQIVYIPKEFFTYFAYQYNSNGTGRSLLSDVNYLVSLRAVSMYAKVANQIRNAISITDVNVTMDPRDPMPQKTIEKIIDLTSQTRTQMFPWGLNTPSDIASWWHRAGFQLHVEGHPHLPTTKIEYQHRGHEKNIPNIDDDDTLNDMIHMHFGITPEMRDAGLGAQFATSIANSNILFSKRVTQFQKVFNKLFSDYIRVLVNNDGFIVNKVRAKIKENWAKITTTFDEALRNFAEADPEKAIDFFTDEVIDTLTLTLPKPDMTSIQNQMTAFKDFTEALEETFKYILSDDAVSQSVLGENADRLVALREPLRAQIIRDWMRKNNFMPELFDLIDTDENGKPRSIVAAGAQEYLGKLALNITTFMREFTPVMVATSKDIAAIDGENTEDDGNQESNDF